MSYQSTHSLPGFAPRYSELSFNKSYDGNHRAALDASVHACRCDQMYGGSDFASTPLPTYLHEAPVELPDGRVYDGDIYAINGKIFRVIGTGNMRKSLKIAYAIARMEFSDWSYILDDMRCGYEKGNSVIVFAEPFLEMLPTLAAI